MNRLVWWRNLTLIGLWGLMSLIIVWNVWLAPIQLVPRWLEVSLLLAPLLLLVRGIWQGNTKTLVYAVLVSLLYLMLGIWIAIDPPERVYGYALIAFSICLYAGGFMSAKVLGKKA
ncbi:DUF2069 domain-containing protein [Thiothrix fructosivorans]|uniref:DUF2069 domain-containing protein n=1 Tax=Thiothrix fructosivorans TaxID=111770 RepID=A0A8B0SEM0_9GAMM|nr:DUF2069 domain-containing protein [Thiothrix fructosivorans]MBO0611866.1 DUF2069 domain-containing protein [Thiothrix fructosivorans]QTX10483.1 DUF2069 domain-containing protein [Thiothrix fructosivorans]